MTSPSESNSTTDSAPPPSGASTVTEGASAKGLTSSSPLTTGSRRFFGSPESEGRYYCPKCRMDSEVGTPDVCESPKSPEIVSPISTLQHVTTTKQALPAITAKRARDESVVDSSKKSNKKKRKFGSILKGMMSPSLKPTDVDKERDALRRGLGGGSFEKVVKI